MFLTPLLFQYEPTCVICLEGATLRQLAGGRRKRDLKRAFALIDGTGARYFLVAGSDRDYNSWVRQLQDAIRVCSPNGPAAELEDMSESHHSESFLDRSRHSIDSALNRSGHGRPLGKSISRAVMAAKATGRAVADRRRRNNVEQVQSETQSTDASDLPDSIRVENEAVEGESEASTPGRGQPFRNRFAGVGQATKSRFGNALQNARQKGKDVAERRRRNRENRGDDTTTDSSAGTEPPGLACPVCTYSNGLGATHCEMCQSELDSVHPPPGGSTSEGVTPNSPQKKANASEEVPTDAETPEMSSVSGSSP